MNSGNKNSTNACESCTKRHIACRRTNPDESCEECVKRNIPCVNVLKKKRGPPIGSKKKRILEQSKEKSQNSKIETFSESNLKFIIPKPVSYIETENQLKDIESKNQSESHTLSFILNNQDEQSKIDSFTYFFQPEENLSEQASG